MSTSRYYLVFRKGNQFWVTNGMPTTDQKEASRWQSADDMVLYAHEKLVEEDWEIVIMERLEHDDKLPTLQVFEFGTAYGIMND